MLAPVLATPLKTQLLAIVSRKGADVGLSTYISATCMGNPGSWHLALTWPSYSYDGHVGNGPAKEEISSSLILYHFPSQINQFFFLT